MTEKNDTCFYYVCVYFENVIHLICDASHKLKMYMYVLYRYIQGFAELYLLKYVCVYICTVLMIRYYVQHAMYTE